MKMRTSIFLTVLCAAVLMGCGKKEEIVQPTTETIVTEETVVSEEAQTPSEEIVTSTEKSDEGAIATLESNLENMLMPMDALMMCMTENEYQYRVDDPTVFWAALYYTLGNYGTILDNVTVNSSDMEVPRQVTQEFATALFADYDELPEIPENLNAAIHYDEEKDAYIISLGDRGLSASRVLDDTDNGDGTYTVTAELYGTDDDATICKWQFTLVENQYADGIQEPLFYYSIRDMQEITSEK